MEVKLFEIRDAATFIPIMCIKLSSRNEEERYLLARAGYGQLAEVHKTYVMMIQIAGGAGQAICDFCDWNGRTYYESHHYIYENWNVLKSGDVIDVEYIIGKSSQPKVSERISNL